MRPARKAALGLLLTLAVAWAWHGPLGQGERLIDRLQDGADQAIVFTELTAVKARVSRDPLARTAFLSGPANDLQREGLGSGFGVSDYVRTVEGLSDVRWTDEPDARRRVIPLLAETSALAALAYLIGLGLGWLLWGRPRREGYY